MEYYWVRPPKKFIHTLHIHPLHTPAKYSDEKLLLLIASCGNWGYPLGKAQYQFGSIALIVFRTLLASHMGLSRSVHMPLFSFWSRFVHQTLWSSWLNGWV